MDAHLQTAMAIRALRAKLAGNMGGEGTEWRGGAGRRRDSRLCNRKIEMLKLGYPFKLISLIHAHA